jgi:hypothetical protein
LASISAWLSLMRLAEPPVREPNTVLTNTVVALVQPAGAAAAVAAAGGAGAVAGLWACAAKAVIASSTVAAARDAAMTRRSACRLIHESIS